MILCHEYLATFRSILEEQESYMVNHGEKEKPFLSEHMHILLVGIETPDEKDHLDHDDDQGDGEIPKIRRSSFLEIQQKYVSHCSVLPHFACLVHHGGVGTVNTCMRKWHALTS